MSWIQKLYETYERVSAADDIVGDKPWPLAHIVKRAHVEVVVGAHGEFRRCRRLDRKDSPTLIQASEFSAGRTRDIEPHPLCDELGYCAPDLPGRDEAKHSKYLEQLDKWISSPWKHSKIVAVRAYLTKGVLWADLNHHSIFPVSVEDAQGRKTKIADEKVFVRWCVEEPGIEESRAWLDKSLIAAWIDFDRAINTDREFCMIAGTDARMAKKHPRFIRSSVDGAKLISSNDDEGYTYRGRFTDGKGDYGRQACSVSFDVSQKAHSALRWLIARQGYRGGDQVVVSWATSLKPIPRWFDSTLELFGISDDADERSSTNADTAQAFGIRLRKAISGYGSSLKPTDDIVVLALDSTTGNQGRMAITFYRELKGSEFLARIEGWHEKNAWPQAFARDKKFVGAPAPRDIAEAVYGRWDDRQGKTSVDEKLLKLTVERLLPCIIDGQQAPSDLVVSACRRATNRIAFKKSESGYEGPWEKCLGIACALYRGYHTDRSYQMSIEQGRVSRDYLYGRLLAIADSVEGYALSMTEESKKRETTAARMMQRFAERPFSTWRNIELSLVPYKARLQAGSDKAAGFLAKRKRLLDEVMSLLDSANDRTSDAPLTGEFLLGYHCQRQVFWPSSAAKESGEDAAEEVAA